jgi:hypothetical protein
MCRSTSAYASRIGFRNFLEQACDSRVGRQGARPRSSVSGRCASALAAEPGGHPSMKRDKLKRNVATSRPFRGGFGDGQGASVQRFGFGGTIKVAQRHREMVQAFRDI